MNRSEKAKLLQSLTTKYVAEAALPPHKAVKTFEIDGEQIPYEAERPIPNEAHAEVNRAWLRQARACAERNDD